MTWMPYVKMFWPGRYVGLRVVHYGGGRYRVGLGLWRGEFVWIVGNTADQRNEP